MADLGPAFTPHRDEQNTGTAALMNLKSIIGRIEETVEAETASIRTDIRFDIKSSNARKSRYLYELNKAISSLGSVELQAEHREGIIRLREKLAANEVAVKAHLNAVSEVANLMQDAIERAEADGTYSASEFGRQANPS
jgi:di/tripeptidase